MAIRTVNAENLASYVEERQIKTAPLQTVEQVTEAVNARADAQAEGKKLEKPVIKEVVETISTSPEPSGDEPTAKAQADIDKAKAGTDPAVQKRIDKLSSEKREVEEAFEAEYNLRIEAERQLKALQTREPEKVIEQAKEELKRPRLSDFEKPEDFDTAMDAYEAKQRDVYRAEAENAARAQAALERANEELGRRYAQAEKDIGGDFKEVIAAANAAKLTPPPWIQAALREGEYGVHVAYYLAKNPEELTRLEGLSQVRAVAEIGKLEMRFAKSAGKDDTKSETKTTTTVETTRAPEPITSVKTDTGIVTTDFSKSMSFKEYRAARLAEQRRKRH